MDVETSFLKGYLEEEIYIDKLEGFVETGQESKVCKLTKSLYGLKQAPKQWYEKFDSCMIENGYCGAKDLGTPAHFISGSWPMPRRKKCLMTNKGNPNCQDILLRTTLSSADQNHGRGKRHITRGSPLEHPKGSFEPNGPAVGAWQKSNSRRSCHLRIKYP